MVLRFSLAVKLRTPLHISPFAPFLTCMSHDQESGSLFTSQYAITILHLWLDLDPGADIHHGPNLLDLFVGHRDASIGPVAFEVQGAEPAEAVGQSVDHNVAARGHPALGRVAAVVGVRIGHPQGQVEAAARMLEVDDIKALRRSAVALLLL